MQGRRSEAAALLRSGLAERSSEPDGSLRLVFRGDEHLRAAVRDLIRREHVCCPFFDFTLGEDGDALTVVASAPEAGRELLDALFAPA